MCGGRAAVVHSGRGARLERYLRLRDNAERPPLLGVTRVCRIKELRGTEIFNL
jgi:hypothetical protein